MAYALFGLAIKHIVIGYPIRANAIRPCTKRCISSLVTLNGAQSTGADGSLITYQWSMATIPAGSAATIINPTTVNPTFTPDLSGQYSLKLVITDTKSVTSEATVTITASVVNAAPVANAGAAQSVVTGAVVTLDGSASSDANGDLLTYSWAFTSKPTGSSAALSSATVAKPTFTADVAGAYVLNLVVNDGKVNSAAVTVTITASVANAAPVANAYNVDGTLDTTFNRNGKVTTDFNSGSDYAYSILVQPDGKVLVAGTGNYGFALARYNIDGSLDTGFDGDGKAVLTIGSYTYDTIYALSLQADGKILAGGVSNNNFALARYNTNETLDPSFGSGGKLTTDFGGGDIVRRIIVQQDGKILVVGGSDSFLAIARYTVNGTLDTSFGVIH